MAKSEWVAARTAHFELYSNASVSEAREVLTDLEEFRALLLSGLKLPPGREPITRVVAFRSERDFEPFQPLFNGKAKKLAGYFVGGADRAYIAVRLGRDRDEAQRTIYHEYVHQIFSMRGLTLPLWLNEGLAEFYSTFRMKKGLVILGTPLDQHVEFLRRSRRMAAEDLARIGLTSTDYNEGFRQGIFYAQSWALVHFMLCGKSKYDFSAGVGRLISLQSAPELSDPERFQKAFGVDYATMDRELTRYLNGGRFYLYKGETDSPPVDLDLTFAPADPQLLDCALIELEWIAQQRGDTAYRLLAMAEKYPQAPRVVEVLGSIAWRDGDLWEARKRWRQAATRGSENPFVHVQSVQQTLDDTIGNGRLDFRFPPAMADELRSALSKALDLSPD